MGGRYTAYPEYKDSRVEWLASMPKAWDLRKAKYLFSRVRRSPLNSDGIITAFRDGEVTLRSKRRVEGFTNAVKEIGYQGVRRGDLLVHSMDGFAGAIGISDSDGKCSPVCSVCIAHNESEIYMRYYGYLVRQLAVTDYITSLAKGIRERSTEFRYNEFSGLTLALPTKSEQTQIAKFLDHETGKIDRLIRKQQELIALLKEKRQAVISHAVTKGLNPHAPMKDSGVEWLGEVPEPWEVVSFAQCVSITGGLVDPRVEPFKGYAMIAPNHIASKSGRLLKLETAAEQGAESGKYLCEEGDVIYSKIRPALAKACVCPTNDVLCSADMYPMKGVLGLSNAYLFRLVLTNEFTAFTIMESDRVAMPKMNRESLGSTCIPIPPATEQSDIVRHIDTECSKIDKLVDHTELVAQLLQERRTALISAAVTGKIDVRDWQEPSSENTEDDA